MARWTPGVIIPIDGGGGPVRFSWNPFTIEGETADPGWTPIGVAGAELPKYHYTHGNDSVIAFEMDLSWGSPIDASVAGKIKALVDLTKPTAGGNVKRPPKCILILGSRQWKCIVKQVQPQTSGIADPGSLDPRNGKVRLTLWRVDDD